MTTNNVTVTINNQTVTADMATIAALLGMVAESDTPKTAKAAKAAKSEKPARKAHEVRTKHDAILDTKRVARMVKTATDKFTATGIEVKTSKQGKWMWIYPAGKSSGIGRSPEFKAVKLAQGWKYSPKRAAFFRDFS